MPGNMPSKPIAGLFTLSNIVTLLAIVIMLRLGYWQLQRAEEKQQLLSVNETRRGGASVDIAHLDRLQGDRNDYPVTLSGYFLEEYFLWDNRTYQGKVGYEVLALLGEGPPYTLVNLGWVAATPYRDQLPKVTLPSAHQRLQLLSWTPRKNPLVQETEDITQDWPKRIQQPDLNLIQDWVKQPLLNTFARSVEPIDPQFTVTYQPVVMSPERHIAYAIQWFGLAFAGSVIFMIATRKKSKK